MQSSRLRDHARSQAKEAAHAFEAARDLLHHLRSTPNMAALHPCNEQLDGASTRCDTSPSAPSMGGMAQTQLEGTSTRGDTSPSAPSMCGRAQTQLEEQIAQTVAEQLTHRNLTAVQEEVTWLRSVVEGVVGLQQDNIEVEQMADAFPSSQLGCCQRHGKQPQISGQPRQVPVGCPAQRAGGTISAAGSECHACLSEKNKRTIRRRLRRNDCRRRFVAGQAETNAAADDTAAHSAGDGGTASKGLCNCHPTHTPGNSSDHTAAASFRAW